MSINGGEKPRVDASKDGRTKQSFAQAADVNTIVGRYRRTGVLENLNNRTALFLDASGVMDYHSMANKVAEANQAFEAIPAWIRTKFGNSPANLLAFLKDPKNRDQAVAMGMLKQVEKPAGVVLPAPPADKVALHKEGEKS